MFTLTKHQIAALSLHKGNVSVDGGRTKKVVEKILDDLQKDPVKKASIKELGGYSDLRSLSISKAKGELSLKTAIVLSQTADCDPAYLIGSMQKNNGYAEESVREFLRKHNMESVLEDQLLNQTPIRTSILTSDDELKKIAETAIAKVERNEAFSKADINTFQQLLAALHYKVNTNPTEETKEVLLLIKILLTYWMK